jgi:hypothetical protein
VARLSKTKIRHVVAILDDGRLEPQCLRDGEAHWRGDPVAQTFGAASAYVKVRNQLSAHAAETGHEEVK